MAIKQATSSRCPKNPAEGAFWTAARQAGWTVSKRGWPDFACWRGDRLIAVEVKPTKRGRLKPHQAKVMEELANRGIDCYRWSPDVGFTKIHQTASASPLTDDVAGKRHEAP